MTDLFRVDVFSAKPYDRHFLQEACKAAGAEIGFVFHDMHLTADSVKLAEGAGAVCAFVNDDLSAPVLEALDTMGVKLVALRSAGFNNVDLEAAAGLGVSICRVPAYSPHAVAEHAVALMLTLNRKTHRAYNRVREGNFALDGLMGFDFHGKTVGIVGTGLIGQILTGILTGFGCKVIASDPAENPACIAMGARYVSFDDLIAEADIISLQCPLTPQTRHLINADAVSRMKPGVMLINTSRGAVIETAAVIEGLKSSRIGSLGLDVYEEESELFFEDLSNTIIPDDLFARLLTFPNVLITGHQGFFTREALAAIAGTTVANIASYRSTGRARHPVEVG
ncbi:2-hydroxyacid dehydrogenase [Roseibium litorale]|uniref:2-hydroxyacid dehydrogenase n=1 Tax=Roseibium litorale TaxID=2803841 RepID=A0ABR9CT93_9HYPH|nr:2-hydroxyacid dehydrogenase [Roseibium litorale]MBD8894107.1 2-hydroxyacid dehydrogenase [Roseibium litorale]